MEVSGQLHVPRRFTPGKVTRHTSNKTLDGSQNTSGGFCRRENFLYIPDFEPRIFQAVASLFAHCAAVYLLTSVCYSRGRDSSVGIATRYGLDGLGIESQWGSRFFPPVNTGPGGHPASYTTGTGSFPGVKRPGHGVNHLPPSSSEVKGRVELYFYSPSGPSWPVLG